MTRFFVRERFSILPIESFSLGNVWEHSHDLLFEILLFGALPRAQNENFGFWSNIIALTNGCSIPKNVRS